MNKTIVLIPCKYALVQSLFLKSPLHFKSRHLVLIVYTFNIIITKQLIVLFSDMYIPGVAGSPTEIASDTVIEKEVRARILIFRF